MRKLACILQDYEDKKWIVLKHSKADESVNTEQVFKLKKNKLFSKEL